MHLVVRSTPKGLYCPSGDFYIDPRLPVPRAVITHAHSDHAQGGSGEYFAARAGVALLERRLGPPNVIKGVPYGEVFKLGEAEVSFHPAGHILGSSQVRVRAGGDTWVISGDYKRAHDPTCAPFEVVPCDTFITEATFALPIYRWESGAKVAEEVIHWWKKNEAAERASVLYCYSLGKAQRVLAELQAFTDRTVFTHGAVEALVSVYRKEGVSMLPTQYVGETKRPYAGELIIAPPSAAGSSWTKRFGDFEAGFASGWMRIRGNRRRKGYDRGFTLSDHADWPALIQTIKDTGAKQILVTHGASENLVRYLAELGIHAAPLSTTYEGEVDE